MAIEARLAPGYVLPVPLTPLVGREREVMAVCTLLKHPDRYLLTLTGTGGVGKTRLGLHVAQEMARDFADGVCFVPLAPVNEAGLVIATIAQSLELRAVADRSLFEQVVMHLREKHMLLLLDNFEQVVDAASVIVKMLQLCPNIKALVTSRAVLRVNGEYTFVVSPLALPDMRNLPPIETLPHVAAVALFLQRATALKADFALTGENAHAISEICVRLDGLPLAIELAAAWIPLLSPQALLQRLEHRLQILTRGSRDLPARQLMLRTTIQWSDNLLSADEQKLFRLLSIFVGGCTLEAIEEVCASTPGYETLDALHGTASLLEKSLLQQVEHDGTVRLYMLETIREYAQEQLLTGNASTALRHAHAVHYTALAEQAEQEMESPQQARWLERLELDNENFRAALHRLAQQEESADRGLALRLAGALWWFWSMRGYASEGSRWLAQALLKSEGVPTATRAKALNSAGMLALNQDNYAQAEVLCEESLALYRQLTDTRNMATCLYRLGLLRWWRANYSTAQALGEESLALFRELGDKGGMADPLLLLSNISVARGEYARSRLLVEESLSYFRAGDDRWGIAYTLLHLARVISAQGDIAQARATVEECFSLSTDLGYKSGIADALGLLGLFAFREGDNDTAYAHIEKSLALFRDIGDRRSTAKALFLLADVEMARNDTSLATSLYQESLAIASAIDDKALIYSCQQAVKSVQKVARECNGAKSAGSHAPAISLSARANKKAADYPAGLTTREIDVLRLIAKGMTDFQVAEQLIISHRTVHAHLASIYGKLNVSSRGAAACFAFEYALL